MIALAVSDERADAHNSVVDVLGKLVAENGTNVGIRLADKTAANPPRSGTVSRSQTMTLGFMQIAAH